MNESRNNGLKEHFSDLPDPRVVGRSDHLLIDIVIIAICAVLCGAEGWEEIEAFGRSKEGWLRQFLDLPNGIPSHDTFRRVFSLLDAEAFQERFSRWVEGVFGTANGEVVAFDGKALRGSHQGGKGMPHLVSAWAVDSHLILGQRKVDDKSNEITALPKLLKELYLKGCIVTIDAMGCQKDIAAQIVDQQADYVLALKGNQARLLEDVQGWFEWAQARDWRDVPHSFHQTITKGHGRIEFRRCWALSDPRAFEMLGHHDGWKGLQSIVMLERERRSGDTVQSETAYFISSLPADAAFILRATRHHWGIENSLHWTLDITFREDEARLRAGNSAENFATLRRIAFNLLKRHPGKDSIKRKRFRAALDHSYLLQLLTQF